METKVSVLLGQFIQTTATEKDKELLEQMIFYYINEYENVKKQSNNVSAIFSIQNHMDTVIKENYVDRVFSCKAGCYYCCEQYVEITDDEAELIMRWVKRNNIPLFKRKLLKQRHYDLSNWRSLNAIDRRCVFLGKNKQCRIYDYRPLVCRKHFSAGDPKDCDVSVSKIIPLGFDMHVEAILSAVMTKSNMDGMATQLLKVDKRLKNYV